MDGETQPDVVGDSELQNGSPLEAPDDAQKKRQKNDEGPRKRRKSGGEQGKGKKVDTSSLMKSPRRRVSEANIMPTNKSAHIQINAQPTRPGHVRFGSEDPPQHWEEQRIGPLNDELLDENEEHNEELNGSDEDAPEDISAAAARATTRATKAKAARAVESQRQNDKLKRRERETRLKEQAILSARSSRRLKASELPDLLPEEVLADDNFTRAPTPPTATEAREDVEHNLNSNKIRFEDNEPKDIQVGPVKVSVLKKRSGLLVPKASYKTQSLKQQWLLGRRGSVVNRQSMKTGFLRS